MNTLELLNKIQSYAESTSVKTECPLTNALCKQSAITGIFEFVIAQYMTNPQRDDLSKIIELMEKRN